MVSTCHGQVATSITLSILAGIPGPEEVLPALTERLLLWISHAVGWRHDSSFLFGISRHQLHLEDPLAVTHLGVCFHPFNTATAD